MYPFIFDSFLFQVSFAVQNPKLTSESIAFNASSDDWELMKLFKVWGFYEHTE